MIRARVLVVLVCAIGCFGIPLACSLNPQPLPPDNPDGSKPGIDAAGGGFDGSAFADAAVPTDGAPTATDGAAEDAGTDGAVDASGDASGDAAGDGAADAAADASADGAADATSD